MKIAYFDCFSGAAGDMLTAAMLDAGLDFEFLKSRLKTLNIPQNNFNLTINQVKRAGLRALHFIPIVVEEHHHRHLDDIKKIIEGSQIGEKPKQIAITIFERLAQAEAKVHGKNPNEIHFHEVGAIDSIIDIVSAAIGLDALGIEKTYCSPLAVGGGTVKSAHGLMPVPSPATAELLKGVPIIGGPIDKELLTPTGAAILTTLVEAFGPMPQMKIEASGTGAGTLDSDQIPNVVRLFIGQAGDNSRSCADSVCLLETNIDDINPEIIASATDGLLAEGALDVWTTPVIMKHSRPAVMLSVICGLNDSDRIEQTIFEQGLTFGIRKQLVQRSKLAREFVTVITKFGEIKIKVGKWAGKIVNFKPEFSDCAAAARRYNVNVQEVIQAAILAYKQK